MQSKTPKQYLNLNGSPVISYTLNRFLEHKSILGVVVALDPDDQYWEKISEKNHQKIHRTDGGESRAETVLKALHYLQFHANNEDWVLVHDAARPCLRREELNLLVEEVQMPGCNGGLLAVPVHDTIKKGDVNALSIETVDRNNLWYAQTPQCFRFALLKQALEDALDENLTITDDASAMEYIGIKPKLFEGRSDNIKITRPADLKLAEIYLSLQNQEDPL